MLEALEVDYVDESEVLTPADESITSTKWQFGVPLCGATNSERHCAGSARARR